MNRLFFRLSSNSKMKKKGINILILIFTIAFRAPVNVVNEIELTINIPLNRELIINVTRFDLYDYLWIEFFHSDKTGRVSRRSCDTAAGQRSDQRVTVKRESLRRFIDAILLTLCRGMVTQVETTNIHRCNERFGKRKKRNDS